MHPRGPFSEAIEAWVATNSGFRELARRASEAFRPIVDQFAAFNAAMDRLPDEIRPGLEVLIQKGWYISGEISILELRALAKQAASGDFAVLDTAMSEWVASRVERVLTVASEKFPARAAILKAAFSAHDSSAYELSVPIMLIQCEGICIELLGTKLFSTKNGIPRTKEATDALVQGAFSEVVFLPLRVLTGLSASAEARTNWPEAPNRHEILHGLDLQYSTSLNALKVISLLDYLVTMVAGDGTGMSASRLPPNNHMQRSGDA